MKLLRLAVVPLAISLSQAATAANLNFTGLGSVSSSGYSTSFGSTSVNITAGGKLAYYALAPGLGNSGCSFGICSNAMQNGESLTLSFSKSVTMSSLSIAAWDSPDKINLSASNGSSMTLSGGPLISTTGVFDLSGMGEMTSLTITGASFATLFSVAGVNVSEVSSVPVPAAAWLFGSALAGLVGLGRRRSKH